MAPKMLVKIVQSMILIAGYLVDLGHTDRVVETCTGNLNSTSILNTTVVTSPNHPDLYPSVTICTWQFETNPNCIFTLDFEHFDLEHENNCNYDYVSIYDGNTTEHPLLVKSCGTRSPSTIRRAHKLLMVFRMDGTNERSGFRARYSIECVRLVSPTKDIVTSPNYPFDYPNEYRGTTVFKTTPDNAIKLVLNVFELEDRFMDVCTRDRVELYDGDSLKHLGNYCGSIDFPYTIISTENKVLMVFRSDSSETEKGFKITVSSVFPVGTVLTDDAERKATQYFLNTRLGALTINKWGPDVTMTAVALFLNDPQFFSSGNETGEEIVYELTLQLVSKLILKKRISAIDLALFIKALTVTCIDPKNFFGINIVAELRKRVESSNSTNPFLMLALCIGGENMTLDDVDRLRQSVDAHLRPKRIEFQAMVAMALKCISRQSDINLNDILTEVLSELKKKQKSNGGIGSLKKTALVVQALIATESDQTDFNVSMAVKTIADYLKYHTDLLTLEEMYYVLPIFKWNTLLDINSYHCATTTKTELEDLVKLHKHPKNGSDKGIKVQSTIIIGNDMDFSRTWNIQVPSNSSFFDVQIFISLRDPDFKFRFEYTDGKPYVTGLANFKNNAAKDLFWFIYTKGLTTTTADDLVLVEQR